MHTNLRIERVNCIYMCACVVFSCGQVSGGVCVLDIYAHEPVNILLKAKRTHTYMVYVFASYVYVFVSSLAFLVSCINSSYTSACEN